MRALCLVALCGTSRAAPHALSSTKSVRACGAARRAAAPRRPHLQPQLSGLNVGRLLLQRRASPQPRQLLLRPRLGLGVRAPLALGAARERLRARGGQRELP